MSTQNKRPANVARRLVILMILLAVAYVGAMGPAAWMIARYPKNKAIVDWTNTVFYPVNAFRSHAPSWLAKPYNLYLEYWWMSGHFAGGGTVTFVDPKRGTTRRPKSYWAWMTGR